LWRNWSTMRLKAADSWPISSRVTTLIDRSSWPASTSRTLQQQPNRAGDAGADQACKQQSQDRRNGGDDDRDPNRPLLIGHDSCGAGVDLGHHVGTDLIDLLAQLGSERIHPPERALNLGEVARFELADELIIIFVQEPPHIGYGGFDPAVDVRQRHIVRRGAGVRYDRGDELARRVGFLRNLGIFGPIGLQALGKSRVIRRRLHLGNDHLS
jgi:hypothetical protein